MAAAPSPRTYSELIAQLRSLVESIAYRHVGAIRCGRVDQFEDYLNSLKQNRASSNRVAHSKLMNAIRVELSRLPESLIANADAALAVVELELSRLLEWEVPMGDGPIGMDENGVKYFGRTSIEKNQLLEELEKLAPAWLSALTRLEGLAAYMPGPEWSLAKSCAQWGKLLDISEDTFRRRRNDGTYRANPASSRTRISLALDDLPEDVRAKCSPHVPRK